MRQSRPSVSLASVTKRYGHVEAVRSLDLDIARGEFFTLLGPSGCGKTTTLRVVAGFVEPTGGTVLIDGEDMEGIPPFRRPTNTVFQSYALFPHLSVEDNVAFGLKRKKVPREEVRTRVAEELERVGLSAEATRKPNQLSGGQQQRVALARALVNRPSVLLLDEPLGALDLKLRKRLQVELKEIQRDVGITFVYVTHDQEEALTMSDRIAVMNHGVVEQIAGPEEVYDRPATTFVAGFIGVSNLMPGQVKKAGDPGEVELDAGVSVNASVDGFSAGDRCHAVVRPEKLQIRFAEDRVDAELPNVEGIVESSLYLGTSTQIVVRLPDNVPMTVLVANTDEDERQRLPGGGARVRLSWTPDHMHVRARVVRLGGRRGRGRNELTRRRRNVREHKIWGLTIAVACLLASLALASCGGDDVGGGSDEDVQVAESGPVEGKLTISNWPGYIDPGKNGTVAEFEQEAGVEVEYIDDITSNVTFFGKLQPQLDRGESGGRDMFVVTDWMAKRMYDLGYLQELNHDDLQTVFDNISSAVRGVRHGSRAQVHDPLAGGPERDLGRHEQGSGDQGDLGPLRPQVQGPGDAARRNA